MTIASITARTAAGFVDDHATDRLPNPAPATRSQFADRLGADNFRRLEQATTGAAAASAVLTEAPHVPTQGRFASDGEEVVWPEGNAAALATLRARHYEPIKYGYDGSADDGGPIYLIGKKRIDSESYQNVADIYRLSDILSKQDDAIHRVGLVYDVSAGAGLIYQDKRPRMLGKGRGEGGGGADNPGEGSSKGGGGGTTGGTADNAGEGSSSGAGSAAGADNNGGTDADDSAGPAPDEAQFLAKWENAEAANPLKPIEEAVMRQLAQVHDRALVTEFLEQAREPDPLATSSADIWRGEDGDTYAATYTLENDRITGIEVSRSKDFLNYETRFKVGKDGLRDNTLPADQNRPPKRKGKGKGTPQGEGSDPKKPRTTDSDASPPLRTI